MRLCFSAIDNATRTLIAQNQQPVTCGLFFSLGHSTIVIAVVRNLSVIPAPSDCAQNVAIAISTSVYDRLDGIGTVGAIVGPAISGSFLALVGIVNAVILWKVIRKRRQVWVSQLQDCCPYKVIEISKAKNGVVQTSQNQGMLMTRLLKPALLLVNRPWKV